MELLFFFRPSMKSFKKILISLFIIFNFLTMIRVFTPLETPFFSRLYTPIDKYLSFFSIYQDWMMFSPNPLKDDTYMIAKVYFSDGTTDVYDYELSQKSYINKYLYGEKFRKITSEFIRKNAFSFMWRDAAKFALRKVGERNFYKIPIKVELTRLWATTPDLTAEFIPHSDFKKKYQSSTFYTFEVI